MLFADALTLDAPKRMNGGYVAVRARAARLGHYEYLGREVDPENKHGLRDKAVVNVLRDEGTVFDESAARSFIGKPVTDDHPRDAVTADNWKQHARGTIMGAMREGDYLAFDILLTDAEAIRKIDAGKRELSNGYSAELEFGDFTAPDGTKCEVRQTKIAGNHVAIVDRGRAGPECRIADAATCEGIPRVLFDALVERTYSDASNGDIVPSERSDASRPLDGGSQVATKTITFDGLPLEVTDAAEAAINRLLGQLKDAASAKSTADTALADANKALDTEKGKVAALEQQVKDAAITPDKLQQMVADRAALVSQAKAVDPKIVTDGKTDAEIRRAAVAAHLGDERAKDMSDDAVAGAFAYAAKDAKATDPLRDAIASGTQLVANDADKQASDAYAAMIADLAGVKPAAAA